MLKNIATGRSECTTKYKNKASCNKTRPVINVPYLIDSFASENRLEKEMFNL